MNKGDNGNASYETYTVSILPTGLQIILYNNASIYVTIKTTGITLNPGTWYNFATAYTGGYGTPDYQPNYNGTMKLYINGAECATTVTITGSYIKMDPINTSTFIGSFGQVGSPGSYWATSFNGSVAQTLMYSRQLTSTEVLQNFNATKARFTLDTDAQVFVTAAGITDATQVSAVNTLVTSLKTAGVWTKMRALYPFVGGTAASHKFNLKDPRDLDAAYRLVFNGGWTHTSTGAKPNGTTGYANTFLNESTTLLNNNSHISVYSRTNLNSVSCDIGVTVGAVESNIYAKIDSIFYPRIQANNGGVNIGLVSSAAFYLSNRVNSTQVFGYRNTTKYIIPSDSLGRMNNVFYLAANHRDGTPQHLSSREQAFASIGDGLTDTEATAFYNAVQAFQTSLGRQV